MAEGEVVGSASIEISADLTNFEQQLNDQVNAVIGKLEERFRNLKFSPQIEAADVKDPGTASPTGSTGGGQRQRARGPQAETPAQDVDADVHVDAEKVRTALDKVFDTTFDIKIDTAKLESSVKAAIERALAQPFEVKVNVKGIEGLASGSGGTAPSPQTTPAQTPPASRVPPAVREDARKMGITGELTQFVEVLNHTLGKAGKSFASTVSSSTDPLDQLVDVLGRFGQDPAKWLGRGGTLTSFLREQGIEQNPTVLRTAVDSLFQGALTKRDTTVEGFGQAPTFLERHGTALSSAAQQPRTQAPPVTPQTVPAPPVTPTAPPAAQGPQVEAPETAAAPEETVKKGVRDVARARLAISETIQKRAAREAAKPEAERQPLTVDLTSLADRYGPSRDRLDRRESEGVGGITMRDVAESIDKGRGKYRGIRVETAPLGGLKTAKGEPVAAQYSDRTAPGTRTPEDVFKTGVISIDPAMIKAQWENRAWRESRELSDKTKATPLSDANFPTSDDYLRFVLEHEYQHSQSRRRTRASKAGPRETMGAYEDRINQQALAAMRGPVHMGIPPAPGLTPEQARRRDEEQARMAPEGPSRVERARRELPGAPETLSPQGPRGFIAGEAVPAGQTPEAPGRARVAGTAGPRTAQDARKARSDLGTNNWMDPLRLVSTKDLRASEQNIDVDVSDEVRALIRGAYSDLVEVVKKGGAGQWVRTGKFMPLGPTREESASMTAEEAIRRRNELDLLQSGPRRPAPDLNAPVRGGSVFKITGPNGEDIPVRNVSPRAALIESVVSRIAGPPEKRDKPTADVVTNLLDPGNEESPISEAITRASSAYGRRGLPTRGESGKAGIIRPEVDLQGMYEAAFRLESVGDDLTKALNDLDRAYDRYDELTSADTRDEDKIERAGNRIDFLQRRIAGGEDARGRFRPGLAQQYKDLREIASPIMHEEWTPEERKRRGNLSARGTVMGETLEEQAIARRQSRRRNWERQGGPAVESPLDDDVAAAFPELELALRSIRRMGTRFEPEKADELINRVDQQVREGKTSEATAEFSKARILYGGTEAAEENRGIRALMDQGFVGPLSKSLELILGKTRTDPERRRTGSGANVGPGLEPGSTGEPVEQTFDIVLSDFAKTMQRWVNDFGNRLEKTVNTFIKENKVKGQEATDLRTGTRMYMDALRSGVSGVFAGNIFAMEDEKRQAQQEDRRARDQVARQENISAGAGDVYIDRHAGTALRQSARARSLRNRAQIPRTSLDDRIRDLRGQMYGMPSAIELNKAKEQARFSVMTDQEQALIQAGEELDPFAEERISKQLKSGRATPEVARYRELKASEDVRLKGTRAEERRLSRVQAMARLRVEQAATAHPGNKRAQKKFISEKKGLRPDVRAEALEVLETNLGEQAYSNEMISPARVYGDVLDPTSPQNRRLSLPVTKDEEGRDVVGEMDPRRGMRYQMWPDGTREPAALRPKQLTPIARGMALLGAAYQEGTERMPRIRKRAAGTTQTGADRMAEESFGPTEPTALLRGEDYARQRAERGVGTMHPMAAEALLEATGMPPFGPMTTPRSIASEQPRSGVIGMPGTENVQHRQPGGGAGGTAGTPPGGTPPSKTDKMLPGDFVHVIIAGQTKPVQVAFTSGYAPGASGGSTGDIVDQARAQSKFKRAEARFAMNAENTAFAEKMIGDLRKKEMSDRQIKKVLKAMGLGAQAEAQLGDTGGGGGTVGVGALASRRRQLGLDPLTKDISGPESQRVDARRADLTAEAEAAQRKILRRGFTASVTDVFQAPFFTKQNAAVDRFQRESSQLIRAEEDLSKARTLEAANLEVFETQKKKANANDKRTAAEKKRDNDTLVNDEKRLKDATVIRQAAEKTVRAQEGIVGEARAELPGRGRAAVNLGIGAGAAAGAFALGSIVYQFAGEIMGMISQGLEAAAGPAIERAMGFSATAARVSGESREAFTAGGGSRGAIIGSYATTGIAGGNIEQMGPLADRAATQAGNENLKRQVDLMHSLEKLRTEDRPTSYDRALTEGTGGLFDTFLFGVPSTAEIMKNELEPQLPAPMSQKQRIEEQIAATKAEVGPEAIYQPGNEDLRAQWERGQAQTLANLELSLRDASSQIESFGGEADRGQKRLDWFNKAAKAGGESMLELTYGTKDQAEASAKLAEEAGQWELAQKMRDTRTYLKGARTDEDVTKYEAAVNLGAQTPSPEALLRLGERERKAQIQLEDKQTRLQTETYIPATFGMAQAAQPIGDITKPLAAAGVRGAGLKSIRADIAQINAEAESGIQIAKDFVATAFKGQEAMSFAGGAALGLGEAATFSDQFAKSLDKVAKYGQQISDIQIGVQTEQAAYAAKQYEVSLFYANRNLRDAQGLASGVGNTLGAVQRQQWNLQRESQALGLGLSQKQINFQKALAGFTTPGDTPQERAARIEQADIEARYAQKQLDIQKQLFSLAGKGFKITVDRNIQDLVDRTIPMLEQGRKVTLDTAEAEAKIITLTKLQQKENARVEAFYNSAVQRTNDVMGEEAKLVAATGKDLREISELVLDTYVQYYKDWITAINGMYNSATTGGSSGTNDRTQPQAAGFFGSVTGRTTMTVGEAGPETVAVLRNPRQVTTDMFDGQQGGVGGQNIVINITGNTVRSDDDLRILAQKIEMMLNQKAALLGYRKPV